MLPSLNFHKCKDKNYYLKPYCITAPISVGSDKFTARFFLLKVTNSI